MLNSRFCGGNQRDWRTCTKAERDGLGSAAVEGVGRRDVEAVLDDIQVPVGQVGHRKAQQRLRGRGSRVSNGRSVCQDLRQPMTLSMVRRC